MKETKIMKDTNAVKAIKKLFTLTEQQIDMLKFLKNVTFSLTESEVVRRAIIEMYQKYSKKDAKN